MKATKWTHGAHTSSWFDAVNWSQGVPVAGEAVQFLGSRAVAVSLAGAQGAQSGAMTVLGDAVTTRDGWWLLETASNHLADGFSSETLRMWNTDGVEVMRGLQSVAIFG